MRTIVLVMAENKPWNFSSNKGITAFVDGERYGNYWDCSKKFIFKDVKRRLGVKRAKFGGCYGV